MDILYSADLRISKSDCLVIHNQGIKSKKASHRNQHSMVFQIPSASKDAYKKSFFPQTIKDWNVLPDSLISSAELSTITYLNLLPLAFHK